MRRDNLFPEFTPLAVINVESTDPSGFSSLDPVTVKSEELIAANKEAANTVLNNIISSLPEDYITITTAKRIYVQN